MTPEEQQYFVSSLGIPLKPQDQGGGLDSTALISGLLQQSPQFQASQAELARRVQEGTQGLSPAQYEQYKQNNANDERYGNDLSWLDPSFQYQANLLGKSKGSEAYADAGAIASQNSAMQQAQQLANSNLQFGSDAQQQAALSAINAVKSPQFAGAGTQQDVLNRALGLASNTGAGALSFDTSGRQGEQYGNLQGIIAGGGADAIEMARRQAARADSESWLRGQREADMADYAERGLTGSGMELLNLAADRQAAAGRNSAADLQTAAALEERKLAAINSASGLATNMRGQTIDEQGLLNTRQTAGLNVAGSLANSMRASDIQEQLGLSDAALAKAKASGDLSSTMRTQTANEQLGNRNAQLDALATQVSAANAARNASAQEAQYRASAEDDFSTRNQTAINNAASQNTGFLQTAYQQMMNNRQQWDLNNLNQQLSNGQQLVSGDRADAQAGWTQGTNLGASDATTWNNLSAEQRNQIIAIFQGGQQAQAEASQAGNAAAGQIASGGVGAGGMAIGAAIGGAAAGSAAGGMTAGQGAVAGAQAGSQALTKTTPEEEEAARRRGTLSGSYTSGGFG